MIKKLILFNAPPHSGKDTAVMAVRAVLAPQCGPTTGYAVHEKMAAPLKKAVHQLFGLFYEPEFYDDPRNIAAKDEKLVKLFGMSPREAYIWMSEVCVKPSFGKDAFGKMMVNKIKANTNSTVHLFSDAGFVDEIVPLVDAFGAENMCIIELHASKDGVKYTFDGDSRSYIGDTIQAMYPKITLRRVHNDIGNHEDKEWFRMLVLAAVKKFLEIEDKV